MHRVHQTQIGPILRSAIVKRAVIRGPISLTLSRAHCIVCSIIAGKDFRVQWGTSSSGGSRYDWKNNKIRGSCNCRKNHCISVAFWLQTREQWFTWHHQSNGKGNKTLFNIGSSNSCGSWYQWKQADAQSTPLIHGFLYSLSTRIWGTKSSVLRIQLSAE